LDSYRLFQKASLVEETVWSNVMRGLSMRNYKEVLQQFAEAYGLEKSTVSEHFIAASRKKLEGLMTRSLAHLQICALVIDGTIFKGQHLVVAIGIDNFGHKIVLGLIQGANENATVVSRLLDELAARGLSFSQPVSTCWMEAEPYGQPLCGTPATLPSFSAVRCIRSAM
jgi:transposase-like protein